MTLATLGSIRLFVEAPSSNDWQDSASQDNAVAGRLDSSVPEPPEIVNPAPEPVSLSVTISRSAPAASYLEDFGLASADARRWSTLMRTAMGVRNFERSHVLTLYEDPATGELRGIKYNLNDRVAVNELTYGAGVIRINGEPIRYVVRPVVVSFKLTSNFWREARRNALPPTVVATMEYAFKNSRPLGLLPRGSDVKLIYQEKVSRDGNARYVTGLQAAQIQFGRKVLTALAFRDEDGRPRLYDVDGRALGTEPLRYPLDFQYISSGFNLYRYHPILHEFRPHVGVDLVARYGTPVRAVADGRVETAGWCGELGRCVRILHDGGIASIYGHLSQIQPELNEGSFVEVGQVIGKVGSSGLSTGPHLHYAVEQDGHYVNPLTANIGSNHRVGPRMRALFEGFKADYLGIFDRLPAGSHGFVNSPLASIFAGATPGVAATVNVATVNNETVGADRRRSTARTRPAIIETTAETTVIDGRRSVMR
jgi:murein DD-endopeptidase MepM/ murein hydrolase activator NlpD